MDAAKLLCRRGLAQRFELRAGPLRSPAFASIGATLSEVFHPRRGHVPGFLSRPRGRGRDELGAGDVFCDQGR